PPGLQQVLDRCLEKDPAKRFPNVAEVTIALLPFAPSKARVSAERTSGVLHAADRSIAPYKHDSLAPPSSSGAPSSGPAVPVSGPVLSVTPSTSMSSTQGIPPSTSNDEAIAALAREAQKTRVILLAVTAVVIAAAAVIVPVMLLRSSPSEP